MAKKKQNPNELATLRIEGEMTIYRAQELKDLLLDALHQSQKLEIDLSSVTELDTCGLQLLMLAKKVALATEAEVQLAHCSPAVLDVVDLLNLAPFFGEASAA